jgi:uncharacterized membrane protein YhiD involved in acid resistance
LGRVCHSRLLDLCISISIAFVLATLIGAERQWRQRNAGLRTNVLVAIGAAAFVTLFVWFVILCGLPSGGLQLSVV